MNIDDILILFGMGTTVSPVLLSPRDGVKITGDSVLVD